MDDLRQMQLFATVVQQGSMSAAARLLKLTPSAVSQQIKALELRAGVTLLLRTTRSLALTDAGRRFYAACATVASAAERARYELSSARNEPIGELRISAPVGFSNHLQAALGDLLATYPSLSLYQLLDDQRRDLVASRVDLGFAFGDLPDTDWAARRMGTFDFLLCVSPGYLNRHAAPTLPAALPSHDWLYIGADSAERSLNLSGPNGATAAPTIKPRVVANSQHAILSACLAGAGIARLASLDAHAHLSTGRLVRVLPDWTAGTYDIWALTPQRNAQPAKVRLAIEAIAAYLQAAQGVRT